MESVLYSQAEFQGYVDSLNNYVNMLESLASECETKKTQIPSFWDDNEAREYMNAIENNIKVCNNTIFDTKLQIEEFKQSMASMTEIQNVEKATIGEALDVVNSLLK